MKKIVKKNFDTCNRISILTGDIDNLSTDATNHVATAINELDLEIGDGTINIDGVTLGLTLPEKSLHLKFNDNLTTNNVLDSSIYNNDATTSVNTTEDMHVDGHVGTGAFIFNGSTDYLTIPHNDRLNPGTGNFSVSLWIKPYAAAAQVFYTKWEYPAWPYRNAVVMITNTSGQVIVYVGDDNDYIGLSNSASLVGGWHHIVLTMNRTGNAILYVDNSVTSTVSCSSIPGNINTTFPLLLGCNQITNQKFKGSMDDLRIYNHELSVTDIGVLYNSGNGSEIDNTLVDVCNNIHSRIPNFKNSYLYLTYALDMYDFDGGLTYYT